ncbi:IncP-type conjugal transfer protein TraG [Myxococcus llanfairpwllgwyngyllgogerychwyrndrobwllllantysiliogogogochensis]|nr:IncP-type conjugal transfer protein TraG [Myxococcus llanfairpwllgwyngyllgogerychwyrndrobwllllantysiliogogogochensis]
MRRFLHPAHVLVSVLGVVGSLTTATQYLAATFAYQPQLGEPLGRVAGHSFYPPHFVFVWTWRYGSYRPAEAYLSTAVWILFAGVALTILCLFGLAILRGAPSSKRTTYGTARWATSDDLKRGGLLVNDGVVLAQTDDAVLDEYVDDNGERRLREERPGSYLLRHNGPEHVFVFAPTRSGKGAGIVMPTLLTWRGSVLVYDLKKELWHATAGWRKKFSHCIRWEPAAEYSARFNPLLEVRAGPNEVKDVQNIVEMLIDPSGKRGDKDHWKLAAGTLLTAAILHVLYSESDKTLAGVATFLSNPERSIIETLELMLSTQHTPSGPHPVIASSTREALNKSENELSGVVSTACAFLGIYRDPLVARNTSASDFRIADLMHAKRPVSLYFVLPPSDGERLTPVIRLVLNQIGTRLTESMAAPVYRPAHQVLAAIASRVFRRGNVEVLPPAPKDDGPKHRLLMLLDEFPTLGRLSFFERSLAFFAGYKIKCLLIAQSLGQLEEQYGPNNSILDNSHVRVSYGANNEKTAARISEMLGKSTVVTENVSFSGQRLAGWLGNKSSSEQEHGRDLLTPGEVMTLPASDALVIVGGLPPCRARKVLYYADAAFSARANLPPPEDPREQAREFLVRVVSNDWEQRKLSAPAATPPVPVSPANDAALPTLMGGGATAVPAPPALGAPNVEELAETSSPSSTETPKASPGPAAALPVATGASAGSAAVVAPKRRKARPQQQERLSLDLFGATSEPPPLERAPSGDADEPSEAPPPSPHSDDADPFDMLWKSGIAADGSTPDSDDDDEGAPEEDPAPVTSPRSRRRGDVPL